MNIRDAAAADVDAICAIYNYHVRNTIVTFEEADVSAADMRQRLSNIAGAYPWLVAERDHRCVGYAYASRWQERSAYRHSALTTIYLEKDACGQGIGTALYRALLDKLPARSLHIALGGISLPNSASVALHEKCGFKKVAHFAEVGFKFGRWIDVGYWQIVL